MKRNFKTGDQVTWTDPDNGLSSGTYELVNKISDDGEDSIWYIKNSHGSEAEVYQHELS